MSAERRSILQESLAAIERLQARLAASERVLHQPIAIVGAGCRFPGGVDSPERLWHVLREGVDAVSEVPADRWDVDAFYDPDPSAQGKMVTRRAGFLTQVDRFDAQFFGISPREATTLDPQQRLLLETAYEALESAAIPVDRLAGSLTGVFIGITMSDYGQLLRAGGAAQSDVYAATGSTLNAAAGRIAFTFGLQGPCLAIDTACSSSLVAVHTACQSLRTGESSLALAGGVNVILSPDAMVLFSRWGMLSPDGACKTFDAAANGFVRAEGCAVLALKRLADALADGDPVLAVIRGSAVNSDGHSSGLTVPSGLAQQAMLRTALANAGLEPADIDYIEAHGTGTSLGDPIEVEALAAVMRTGRSPGRPLAIGSIKTNIGHAESASGVAGLLKVVMALRNEAIPPHLHFTTPNPGIPWSELPITVPTSLTPWPRSGRARRAGVSSFGLTGTNAHIILEEAPTLPEKATLDVAISSSAASRPYLVPLSARDTPALRELAERYADFLRSAPTVPLPSIVTTLSDGRSHHSRRLALISESAADLQRDLRAVAAGDLGVAVAEGTARAGQQPKVAFVFTGQGAQYAGMGRGLYESEPLFRSLIDKAAAVLAPVLPRPLLQVLFAAEEEGQTLVQTAYTQPALFALEYALAELWRSWGIVPSIVAGHSVGEYVAACVAGVFSFEQGLTLIAERARLMQALPAGGGMAAVFAHENQISELLQVHGNRISIAALNGPQETVIAGDTAALSALLEELSGRGISGRRLEVSHAFHSALLEPMLDDLERRAAAVPHAVPKIPFVSNLTGRLFAAGTGPDAAYWRRHARAPVRFWECLEALRAAGATALVEVGPHPTLLGLAGRAVPAATWTTVPSLRRNRPDRREMLGGLAALYARGAPVVWKAANAGPTGNRLAMPTYPFQRERYWMEATQRRMRADDSMGHPLLGNRVELASSPGTFIWEREIAIESHPWLTDHRVQGAAVVPATAYIEIALAAGREVFGDGSLRVWEIENLKPIVLLEGVGHRVQTSLTTEADGSAQLAVYGYRTPEGSPATPNRAWAQHMTARLERIAPPAHVDGLVEISSVRERTANVVAGEEFYALLARKGNQWGTCFQGMQRVWTGARDSLGQVQVVPTVAAEIARYRFHPAVADACAHALVAAAVLEGKGVTRGAVVGGGVGEMRFHRSPAGRTLWSLARLSDDTGQGNVVLGDIQIFDETGALVSETLNARLRFLGDEQEQRASGAPTDWLYEVRWRPQVLAGQSRRKPRSGPWLLFADRSGFAERLAARLRSAGIEPVLVSRGEAWEANRNGFVIREAEADDYRRLMRAVHTPAVIVHLWSLDCSLSGASDDPLAPGLALGAESVLHVLQSIVRAADPMRPRLWLITAGAQAVVPEDRCEAPWNAALWGLGKSLSAEHAELWGGLVDLPVGGAADEIAEQLMREIEVATAEDKIALRASGRYVPRLERRYCADRADLVVRSDATYLITGGLGGMGLAMARWLAERGAKHLLLLGRTPLPARSEWGQLDPSGRDARRTAAIAAIEALGAVVESVAIDMADEDCLRKCLAGEAGERPPIRGVVHAAGVLTSASLATQVIADLRPAVAAKVRGAWQLHRLLQRQPLDFFVLCSSTSALLNSPLLGAYAAGNACLDALAHHRRRGGLSALSVNWGTWGEVGMAVDARGRTSEMLTGVGTLSTNAGLEALQELLETDATQAAVMPMDWTEFARAYPNFVVDPFLQSQVESAQRRESHGAEGGEPGLEQLGELAPEARSAALQDYLQGQAANVLGLAAERLDVQAPLSSLGFDSLMAVQLKNRIEADLGIVVPIIQFLQGPSVEQLVAFMLTAGDTPQRVAPADGGAMEERWEEGTL